jgi:hypothetical protein
MLLAHKIELQPNEAQKEYLNKCCGTVRHCYNQLREHYLFRYCASLGWSSILCANKITWLTSSDGLHLSHDEDFNVVCFTCQYFLGYRPVLLGVILLGVKDFK